MYWIYVTTDYCLRLDYAYWHVCTKWGGGAPPTPPPLAPHLSSFININLSGIPCITDCVMAELEKMGTKYRVALRYIHHVDIISKT